MKRESMKRQFWGVILVIVGILAIIQLMTSPFSLTLRFWPVVLTLLGLSIMVDSVSRRISWFQLALGAWVGGIGLFDILAESGMTALTGGEVLRHGWPILLVAVGLEILFGSKKGIQW